MVAKLATRSYRGVRTPPARLWERFEGLKPGHFWVTDLLDSLHSQGYVPKVTLSGLGVPKTLSYNECVVHTLQKDCAEVCVRLAALYNERWARKVEYMGETLAGFSGVLFGDLCRPQRRPTLRNELRDEVVARCAGRCAHCGELAEEVGHHITEDGARRRRTGEPGRGV